MRKPFATSIDTDISDGFKKTCDDYDLKMNVVLETFMKQLITHFLISCQTAAKIFPIQK